MTPKVCEALNGTNSSMVNKITGRVIREETSVGKTFDLIRWIRVRKIQWIGHILRMGEDHKLKRVIYRLYVMFKINTSTG